MHLLLSYHYEIHQVYRSVCCHLSGYSGLSIHCDQSQNIPCQSVRRLGARESHLPDPPVCVLVMRNIHPVLQGGSGSETSTKSKCRLIERWLVTMGVVVSISLSLL